MDYAARETDAAQAAYAELHEARPFHDGSYSSWVEKRSKSHPYHFSDGVTIWSAPMDLAPDDKFTTDVNARPSDIFRDPRGGD